MYFVPASLSFALLRQSLMSGGKTPASARSSSAASWERGFFLHLRCAGQAGGGPSGVAVVGTDDLEGFVFVAGDGDGDSSADLVGLLFDDDDVNGLSATLDRAVHLDALDAAPVVQAAHGL